MDLPNLSELHTKAQRDGIDFLKTDLALCSTFAEVANTELRVMRDREAALHAQEKAEKGHATITRLLVHIDDSPQKDCLQSGLDDLRANLDLLQEGFNSATQL